MLKKNSEFELTVTDIGSEGEGIGRVGGMAVFVKGGLPGERLRVKIMKEKKSFAYGKLLKILSPSAARTEPACPAYGVCGGCDLRHCAYAAQLEIKTKMVGDCLRRIGGIDAEVAPAIGMESPFRYRNKAQIPVGNGENGLVAGFYARRSHRIVPFDDCDVQHEATRRIVGTVLDFAARNRIPAYDEASHSGVLRHIVTRTGSAGGEIMVCLVVNARGLPVNKRETEALVSELKKIPGFTTLVLNINADVTNVVMGKRVITLCGPGVITERVGDVVYEISPLSFFQVNTSQAGKLFDTVESFAGFTGGERVLDVYCGAGAISLYVAPKVKEVFGIEASAAAAADARRNAVLNGAKNALFIEGQAEKALAEFRKSVDAVIVDPPEKGCSAAAILAIAQKRPGTVVYVSCNPATLARDLKIFAENGYVLEKAQPVDMFPMTARVECAAKLVRG